MEAIYRNCCHLPSCCTCFVACKDFASRAVNQAPIPGAKFVPTNKTNNKSFFVLSIANFRASARNLRGELCHPVPQPPSLIPPSLPRIMEIGEAGTFLCYVQLCPLPDYYNMILICKSSSCMIKKERTVKIQTQNGRKQN